MIVGLVKALADADYDRVINQEEAVAVTDEASFDECNYAGELRGRARDMPAYRLVRRRYDFPYLSENKYGPRKDEIYLHIQDGNGECAIGPVTDNYVADLYGIRINDYEGNKVHIPMEDFIDNSKGLGFGGNYGARALDLNDELCFMSLPSQWLGAVYRHNVGSRSDFRLNAGKYRITCREAAWAAKTPTASYCGVRGHTWAFYGNQGFGLYRTDYTFPVAGNVLANMGWNGDGRPLYYWCEDPANPGQIDPRNMAADGGYIKEKTGNVSQGLLPGYIEQLPGYPTAEAAAVGTAGQFMEVYLEQGEYQILSWDNPRWDNFGGALYDFQRIGPA